MAETFLFLELLNPEVNGLLYSIRELAMGEAPRTNIHITLRGPYDGAVPTSVLKNTERQMLNDVLFIGNPGMFNNDPEFVVYLAVNHRYLRSKTWKRDFPIKDYGFNPHISLYAGRDRRRAEKLLNFLQNENIELLCEDFKVTTYTRKSPQLIEDEPAIQFFYPKLLQAGRMKVDMLPRLKICLERAG